jgi:hypothetical protein
MDGQILKEVRLLRSTDIQGKPLGKSTEKTYYSNVLLYTQYAGNLEFCLESSVRAIPDSRG